MMKYGIMNAYHWDDAWNEEDCRICPEQKAILPPTQCKRFSRGRVPLSQVTKPLTG